MTPQALKLFREHRRQTQRQLADWLGVDVGTVSKWETGKRAIPRTVELACRAHATHDGKTL